MKALCVKQPWANMIASGEKTIELRSWGTRHRGDLIICSSKKPYIEPAGCALAIVNLVDCRRATKEDEKKACSKVYVNVDFAWVFGSVRRITTWPIKGGLGLFNLPYEED